MKNKSLPAKIKALSFVSYLFILVSYNRYTHFHFPIKTQLLKVVWDYIKNN